MPYDYEYGFYYPPPFDDYDFLRMPNELVSSWKWKVGRWRRKVGNLEACDICEKYQATFEIENKEDDMYLLLVCLFCRQDIDMAIT